MCPRANPWPTSAKTVDTSTTSTLPRGARRCDVRMPRHHLFQRMPHWTTNHMMSLRTAQQIPSLILRGLGT
ncbi:hypothetical protein Mapa_002286 [Marchantia paleacea]|nr:hypothetical protein Mapa_002286 [Marchantia paleacea]